MSRIQSDNIDYTNRDYEAFRQMMIDKLQEEIPEYTDTSETDAGIVILEALANGLDILSMYVDIIANDVVLPTTQDRRLAIIISKCLGYIPYNQTSSEYEQVFVLSEAQEVDTVIPIGTVVKTKESSDYATLFFETQEDLVIPKGKLGDEKDDNDNYLYTTRIKHCTSVYEDVIGTSSGAPLQSFALNYTGVLIDTIELYVNEGDGAKLWTKVDSFIDCDGTSTAYTISVDDFDVCYIEFGNGMRGKIPTSFPEGISCNYKIGGGEIGNVSAEIITEIDTTIPFVEKTFNLEASVLGHDKEPLESIKENAPATYRARDRIVTLEDYEDLLRIHFYDFLRLKATRDVSSKTLVHIFYMMKTDYSMTDKLRGEIEDFINQKAMIGTSYDLNPYTPQAVNITAKLYVDSNYDKEEIKSNVIAYLEQVIFNYGELLFGDSIVKSDLEQEIKETFDGILSFRINSPTVDIISPSAPQNVLTKGTINIDSQYL